MNVLAILQRAFASNIRTINLSDGERAKLEASGVQEPTIQRYVVWRRATVMMVIVGTLLSAGVSTFQSATEEDQPGLFEQVTEGLLAKLQSAAPAAAKLAAAADAAAAAPAEEEEAKEKPAKLGQIVDKVLELSSVWVLPVAALIVLLLGDRMKLSFKVMLFAFVFSFFLPMLVELLPWSWWGYADVKISPTEDPVGYAKDQLEGIAEGVGKMVALMPAVLSLIPGIVRGCLRVKTLLPQSLLPGWLIVIASPLYALFLFVAFVAVDQINSDPLVFFGLLLVASSSLVYIFRASAITRPLITDEDVRQMRGVQRIVGGMTALGGVLLLTYFMTREIMGVHLVGSDPKTSLMRPIDIVEFLLEIVSRSMFVAAFGADLFMRLNLAAWKQNRALIASGGAQEYDGAMEALEGIV